MDALERALLEGEANGMVIAFFKAGWDVDAIVKEVGIDADDVIRILKNTGLIK